MLPGWKWARGFFSMGSTAMAESCPYVRLTSFPSTFSLVPQNPLPPGFMMHILGQMVQRTVSSVSFSTNRDSIPIQGVKNRRR